MLLPTPLTLPPQLLLVRLLKVVPDRKASRSSLKARLTALLLRLVLLRVNSRVALLPALAWITSKTLTRPRLSAGRLLTVSPAVAVSWEMVPKKGLRTMRSFSRL